jgi:hypothetical protein
MNVDEMTSFYLYHLVNMFQLGCTRDGDRTGCPFRWCGSRSFHGTGWKKTNQYNVQETSLRGM